MKLSIVTTLYHSSTFLGEFHSRIRKEADRITSDHEIIFVNDGSPDNSLDVALRIQENDDCVKIVNLSRNFGHHKAMMTGLSYAKGDIIFLIDCDLEEEPEIISNFYKEFLKGGVDVVYGVQKKRDDGFVRRFLGNLFYKVFNFFSDVKLHPNLVTTRLMSRRYVENLLKHEERQFIIAGLWLITGFKQVPLEITKKRKGWTSYSLRSMFSLLGNAITSFSTKPLTIVFYLGFAIILLSSCYIIYLIIRKIFFNITIAGWVSTVVSVWFFGGLTVFILGIIGVYISRIFIETKKRPYTIVADVYSRKQQMKEIDSYNDIIKRVGNYYTEKINAFSSIPEGVDWNSKDAQEIRFEKLLMICNNIEMISVLSYGCGYGALYEFMKSSGYNFSYIGFDISREMIKRAKKYLPNDPNITLHFDPAACKKRQRKVEN